MTHGGKKKGSVSQSSLLTYAVSFLFLSMFTLAPYSKKQGQVWFVNVSANI